LEIKIASDAHVIQCARECDLVGAKIALIGPGARGDVPARSALFALVEWNLQRSQDAFAQFVLDGKEILHGGIRRFRPKHRAAGRLDQLTSKAKVFAGAEQ
jgi:hypothetical protein